MRDIKFQYIIKQDDRIRTIIYTLDELAGGELLDSFSALTWEIIAKRQYTGRKDKNGKEIYEGDKISNGVISGVIIFEDTMFKIKYKDSKDYILEALRYIPTLSFFIIGNIYENPELLEEV